MVLIFFKCQNKVWLGSYIVEMTEITYGWAFFLENAKISTAVVLFYSKQYNKVHIGFFYTYIFFKNAKTWYS